MKKSEKKIISLVLAAAIIASVFSICATAFAKSQRLILDVLYSDTIDGGEDLLWYIYTPEASGTYSFLSYNVPHSEAYLFTKEENSNLTNKVMTQLAYSQTSPDFAARGQSGIIQFCLTYHLEAGVTYYYAAGWWSDSRTGGTMKVMLTCDEYDAAPVESIDLSCPVVYDENSNGVWSTDSAGNEYFLYDLSRLLRNLTVTVHYTDGTSSSVTGQDEIDGNGISYQTNQNEEHWYPASNVNYTGNKLTVVILGVSAVYNVQIAESDLKSVRLKVVDYSTNEALSGVTLKRGNDSVLTDENGVAVISLKGGENTVELSDFQAITRTVTVNVNSSIMSLDLTESPISFVTGDFNGDSVINGKDYAYIIKNFTGDKKAAEIARFKGQLNFKQKDYAPLVLE